MLFIIGTLLSAFCVIYFCLVLLAVRNPNKKGFWTKPMMVESLHLFLIMGTGIIGPVLIVKGLAGRNSSSSIVVDVIIFACAVVLTIFIVRKMNVKKHLAEFAALEASHSETVANIPDNRGPDAPPLKKAA